MTPRGIFGASGVDTSFIDPRFQQMAAAPPMTAPKPAPKKKGGMWGRVKENPLTFLMQGTGGLDRIDKRREQEVAQAASMQNLDAMQLDPQARARAELAMRFNGDEFGKNIASGFGTNVGAPGAMIDRGLGTLPTQVPYAPMNIADGSTAFDPNTGRKLFENEKEPDPFTLGADQQRFDPQGNVIARGVPGRDREGINLTFGEGGNLSGLSIGGTGTKGNEPAIVRDPRTGAPIVTPGEQQLRANKSWQTLENYQAQNAVVLEDIDRALEMANGLTTGFVGSMLSKVPGTPPFDLAQTINTIKANIGFDKLQAMRDASPTGGALGQVSEMENRLLQSVMGALEASQSQEQFTYNLQRLKSILADTEGRRKRAFAQDYPDLAQYAGFAAGTKEEGRQLNSVQEGSRIRNPQTGEEMILQNGQWVKAN